MNRSNQCLNTFLFLILSLLLYQSVSASNSWLFNFWNSAVLDNIEKGSKQLSHYRVNEGNWGLCWKEAIQKLELNCRDVKANDSNRSKLAVHFTNCHLMKSGLSPYPCTEEMTVYQCTRDMLSSPIAFNAYTEFVSHVDSMCFYIQSEMFQEQTENLIHELVSESEQVSKVLKQVSHNASHIVELLRYSQENQEQLIGSQKQLQTSIETVNEQEKKNFEKFLSHALHIDKITDELKLGVESVSQNQRDLHNQHQQFSIVYAQHAKQMNNAMLQSLEYSHSIKNMQEILDRDVTQLKAAQKLISEYTNRSLTIQNELLDGQSALSDQQREYYEKTGVELKKFEEQANSISKRISESLKQQEDLLVQQEKAKQFMLDLMQHQKLSFKNAEKSITELLYVSQETSDSIRKQQQVVNDSFSRVYTAIDKVMRLHSSLLGEFITIQAIFYYLAFLVVGFLLTSTKYTRNSRVYLFLIMTISVFVERAIIRYGSSQNWTSMTIHSHLYFFRKLSIFVCIVHMLYSWYRYKDLKRRNLELLELNTGRLHQIEKDQQDILFHVSQLMNSEQINDSDSNRSKKKFPNRTLETSIPSSPLLARHHPPEQNIAGRRVVSMARIRMEAYMHQKKCQRQE